MTTHDNESLETWLNRPWPGGLIAVGGYGASGSPFFRHLAQDNAAQVGDECWVTLNEAVAQLAAHGCGSGNSVWVFESATIWVARRPDGAWVGVLAAREMSQGVLSAMKSRLAEFISSVDQTCSAAPQDEATSPVQLPRTEMSVAG